MPPDEKEHDAHTPPDVNTPDEALGKWLYLFPYLDREPKPLVGLTNRMSQEEREVLAEYIDGVYWEGYSDGKESANDAFLAAEGEIVEKLKEALGEALTDASREALPGGGNEDGRPNWQHNVEESREVVEKFWSSDG